MEESDRGRKRVSSSDFSVEQIETPTVGNKKDAVVTSIIDERIQNLREAIEEIDEALAGRKVLNRKFAELTNVNYKFPLTTIIFTTMFMQMCKCLTSWVGAPHGGHARKIQF